MSDIFSEVNEEVQIDKYKALWLKYRYWFLGIVLGITLLIVSILSYKSNKDKELLLVAEKYIKALNFVYEDYNEAKTILESLIEDDIKGYSILSSLSLASLFADDGDVVFAVQIIDDSLDSLSEKDPIYKLSYFISALYLLNGEETEKLKIRIKKISSFGTYWNMLGFELSGYSSIIEKDYDGAKKIFKMIVDDESTTPGGRVRSGQMLDYLEK